MRSYGGSLRLKRNVGQHHDRPKRYMRDQTNALRLASKVAPTMIRRRN
jgi:hypothetical protein